MQSTQQITITTDAIMTYTQLLTTARELNRKANYYLDRMLQHHYRSGKYIDASAAFERYSEGLQ